MRILWQAGLAAQQRQFHWDKRRRQYVQLQPGEQVQAGKRKRTESGKLGAKKKGDGASGGIYKKWVRSSKLRVPAAGELMEGSGGADASGLAERHVPSFCFVSMSMHAENQAYIARSRLWLKNPVAIDHI